MANRIDQFLVSGEIDNTEEGRTTGWLWLLGQAEPVTLDLVGDCWRDLAGVRLKFRNRNPKRGTGQGVQTKQKGVVGDMTVSRKTRVPECPIGEFAARTAAGEDVPMVWKNTVYLEWFSESDGRVVIESSDFDLELSEPQWSMDADAENAQKLANLQAMRDFLEMRICRRKPATGTGSGGDDEFEWEERLKESERLSDAYQEVLEKYKNDPDSEQKGAFVMGWDGLLDEMAKESENCESQEPDWSHGLLEGADDDDEDWDEADLFKQHPLQLEAQELAMRSFDLLREDGEASPDARAVTESMTRVAAKLAGALNGTYEREAGFVLAVLKRCLNWQNEVLACCARLIESETDNDKCRALEALRDEVFLLRQKMTDLRKKLKDS